MKAGGAHEGIAIIGGGFAGSLLALKLAEAGVPAVVIDPAPKAGPGLAYGSAHPVHVLNVPVQRMETGLTPRFADWLDAYRDDTAEGIAEAGDLAQAFVPRRLFGRYLAEQVDTAVTAGRVSRLRGEVTKVEPGASGYRLFLADGRWHDAARVVLATGNLAPKPPRVSSPAGIDLADVPHFIADPWQTSALDAVAPDDSVLIVGTGLTMVDIALGLRARGHAGTIHVVSRHGLLPCSHQSGGAWPAFLSEHVGRSPGHLLRILRGEVALARHRDIPWQRVIDAARPAVAQIWSQWNQTERAQFLRHGRALWDVHRHRLAPRIGAALHRLRDSGRFDLIAGSLLDYKRDGAALRVAVRPRHSRHRHEILVDHVINCTGPRTDVTALAIPLFADLRGRGLIQPDDLGLGLETSDAGVTDNRGEVSDSLFAIGALTRPAWWEVTAVPEIAAQVTRLVQRLERSVTPQAGQKVEAGQRIEPGPSALAAISSTSARASDGLIWNLGHFRICHQWVNQCWFDIKLY